MTRNEKWHNYLVATFPGRTTLPTIDILDLLGEVNETFVTVPGPGGSPPWDMALLRALARRAGSPKGCEYLELGTFRGATVAAVAEIAKHVTTISLGRQQMLERGWHPNLVSSYMELVTDRTNLTEIQANTVGFNFKSLKKQFDLIFIDADHSYKAVVSDTKGAFSVLHPNGTIVWHDYSHDTEDVRAEVLAGILVGTEKMKHDQLYHVSDTCCAIYLPYKFKKSTYKMECWAPLRRVWEVTFKAKRMGL